MVISNLYSPLICLFELGEVCRFNMMCVSTNCTSVSVCPSSSLSFTQTSTEKRYVLPAPTSIQKMQVQGYVLLSSCSEIAADVDDEPYASSRKPFTCFSGSPLSSTSTLNVRFEMFLATRNVLALVCSRIRNPYLPIPWLCVFQTTQGYLYGFSASTNNVFSIPWNLCLDLGKI
jgi:hypothetical protein